MNHLAMVNKVLRRLREDPVNSVDESAYSSLIGDFVEQAVSEVEDGWDWNSLRTTIPVSTSQGVFAYPLTGAGTGYHILCVINDTEDYEVIEQTYTYMNHALTGNNIEDNDPRYYNVNGVDANGDPIVNLYPPPATTGQLINFNTKVKTQIVDDISETPGPWLPCVLLATMIAVEERGDDAGLSLEFLQARFKKTFADATALDAGNNEDEVVWEVE